jgi:HPt (histidine-containing phosphotransfer) domain-containing protein
MPAGFKVRFEELRGDYYARLAGDRSQLMKLRHYFDPPPQTRKLLYDQLQRLAHGMAGTAAVFEAPEVARVAHTLEEAACAAKTAPGDDAHAAVRNALDALVDLLLTVSA